MKTILFILVIALGAAAAYYQRESTATATALAEAQKANEALLAEIETSREETAEAIDHATLMGERVNQLEKDLVEARNNSVTDELMARQLDREQSAAVKATADEEAAAAAQAEAEKQRKRDEALAIYNRHKEAIDKERAELAASLTAAKAALKIKENNKPKFNEHGQTWRNGRWVTTGVRMSQADRAEIIQKHEAELAQAAARIAAAEAERVRIDSRSDDLERAYAAAMEKLR